MLIPIGSDRGQVRRHPRVTHAIVAINVAVFVVALLLGGPSIDALERSFLEIVALLEKHPYLVPPPEIERFFTDEDLDFLKQAGDEMRRNRDVPTGYALNYQVQVLDEKVEEFQAVLRDHPAYRLGFVPARPEVTALITSQFVHAGLMHLLGNMLFLFVVSAFLEDVFGRPLFALFYLSGGAVAIAFHVWQNPESHAPLVGASGAVAAVMGGYLFRFWKSKVEILWLPIFFLPWLSARFFAPAALIIPFWFASDFYFAMNGIQDGNVAVWAHVGGFVYGFGLTALIGLTRIEEKFVDPGITAKTTWQADSALEAAIEARQQGRNSAAQAAVNRALARDPHNPDARQIALDIAIEVNDQKSAETHALHLLDRWTRTREDDLIAELLGRLQNGGPLLEKFLLRSAAHLERRGDTTWAFDLYRQVAANGSDPVMTLKANLKLAEISSRGGDYEGARLALQRAESNPECTGQWLLTVQQQQSLLPKSV